MQCDIMKEREKNKTIQTLQENSQANISLLSFASYSILQYKRNNKRLSLDHLKMIHSHAVETTQGNSLRKCKIQGGKNPKLIRKPISRINISMFSNDSCSLKLLFFILFPALQDIENDHQSFNCFAQLFLTLTFVPSKYYMRKSKQFLL